MSDLNTFLAEQYEAELQAFRASLADVSEDAFTLSTVGHVPAWHALHVCDWLRLTVLQDRTPDYHHLGWEDRPWVAPMGIKPAPMNEDAGRAAVMARLDDVSAQVVACLSGMTATDLNGMAFSPSAPTGERPRLVALGLHLRHIAYHRGQIQLGKKAQE